MTNRYTITITGSMYTLRKIAEKVNMSDSDFTAVLSGELLYMTLITKEKHNIKNLVHRDFKCVKTKEGITISIGTDVYDIPKKEIITLK